MVNVKGYRKCKVDKRFGAEIVFFQKNFPTNSEKPGRHMAAESPSYRHYSINFSD